MSFFWVFVSVTSLSSCSDGMNSWSSRSLAMVDARNTTAGGYSLSSLNCRWNNTAQNSGVSRHSVTSSIELLLWVMDHTPAYFVQIILS